MAGVIKTDGSCNVIPDMDHDIFDVILNPEHPPIKIAVGKKSITGCEHQPYPISARISTRVGNIPDPLFLYWYAVCKAKSKAGYGHGTRHRVGSRQSHSRKGHSNKPGPLKFSCFSQRGGIYEGM